MSAITSLTINDDSGDINTRTFTPDYVWGAKSTWSAKDSQTSAGRPSVTLDYSPHNGNRATDRVKVTASVPFETLVDGAYVVNDVARISVDVVMPADITQANRNIAAYIFSRLLSEDQIRSAMLTGEVPY